MVALVHHKVTELPGSPDPNAIYFVDRGNFTECYVTSNTGVPHLVADGVIGLAFEFEGNGEVLEAGSFAWQEIPLDVDLIGWTLEGSPSGSVKINVRKCELEDFPPASGGSMTAGFDPQLVTDTDASDADLGNWTTRAIDARQVAYCEIESCSAITQAKLVLHARRRAQ